MLSDLIAGEVMVREYSGFDPGFVLSDKEVPQPVQNRVFSSISVPQ